MAKIINGIFGAISMFFGVYLIVLYWNTFGVAVGLVEINMAIGFGLNILSGLLVNNKETTFKILAIYQATVKEDHLLAVGDYMNVLYFIAQLSVYVMYFIIESFM